MGTDKSIHVERGSDGRNWIVLNEVKIDAPTDDKALLSTSTPLGGIDMNKIDVNKQGPGVQIKFNEQQMQNLLNGNFGGFAPVIINIVPIPSFLPLLGLEPKREEELKVSSVQ
mgnify:FL=1